MNLLPEWEKRPITVSNLLNPAFCGTVIHFFINEYQKLHIKGVPFHLTFLVLPIILSKKIRDTLPRNSSKNLITWIEDNQLVKKDLPNLIKNIVPYTKESIMFLLMYEFIAVNEFGNLVVINQPPKIKNNNEVTECYKKSELLGKLLSKVDNNQFIFVNLGIKP